MKIAWFSADPLSFARRRTRTRSIWNSSDRIDESSTLSQQTVSREDRGRLYAELIEALDFSNSRLFGWKQDFPKTRHTMEKLLVTSKLGSLEEGQLLEWTGAAAYGFPIRPECWLEIKCSAAPIEGHRRTPAPSIRVFRFGGLEKDGSPMRPYLFTRARIRKYSDLIGRGAG